MKTAMLIILIFVFLSQLLIYPILKSYEIIDLTSHSVILLDIAGSILIGSLVFMILRNEKNALLYTIVLSIMVFFVIGISRLFWNNISVFTSKLVNLLISLIYSSSLDVSNTFKPAIIVSNWKVIIGATCSGIESFAIFGVLMMFVLLKERKNIRSMHFAISAGIGFLGLFLLNILRIFSIIVIGLEFSRDFALRFFHSNLAWLMFIGYFFLYWKISKQIVIKNDESEAVKI